MRCARHPGTEDNGGPGTLGARPAVNLGYWQPHVLKETLISHAPAAVHWAGDPLPPYLAM